MMMRSKKTFHQDINHIFLLDNELGALEVPSTLYRGEVPEKRDDSSHRHDCWNLEYSQSPPEGIRIGCAVFFLIHYFLRRMYFILYNIYHCFIGAYNPIPSSSDPDGYLIQ